MFTSIFLVLTFPSTYAHLYITLLAFLTTYLFSPHTILHTPSALYFIQQASCCVCHTLIGSEIFAMKMFLANVHCSIFTHAHLHFFFSFASINPNHNMQCRIEWVVHTYFLHPIGADMQWSDLIKR